MNGKTAKAMADLEKRWVELAARESMPRLEDIPGAKTVPQCAALFGCSETKWRDREAKRLEELGEIERIGRVRSGSHIVKVWVLKK